MTVECVRCGESRTVLNPGAEHCPCGGAWKWDDGADKPHRNYDRMTVAWGGTTREAAA